MLINNARKLVFEQLTLTNESADVDANELKSDKANQSRTKKKKIEDLKTKDPAHESADVKKKLDEIDDETWRIALIQLKTLLENQLKCECHASTDSETDEPCKS